MYMETLKVRLATTPSYVNIFRYNLTDKFIASLRRIVNPQIFAEQNMILSVSGTTGSGKSRAIISLCKMLTPDRFSYKNVCFFDQQVLDRAKEVPRDSFIVRDEGTDKATFGIGSMRTSRQLQVMAETCRKYGLSLIFIEPEFRENEIAKYYLEVVDVCPEHEITRLALRDTKSLRYLGAVYIKVVPEDDPDWIEYNKRKDKFIVDVRSGKFTDAKMDYRKIGYDLADKTDIELFPHKKDRMALIRTEYPNLTGEECKLIQTFLEARLKEKGQV